MLYLAALAALGAFLAFGMQSKAAPVPGGGGTLPPSPLPNGLKPPPPGPATPPNFAAMTDVNAIVAAAMNAMDGPTFAAAAARLQQLGPAGAYAWVAMNKFAAMSVAGTFNVLPGETWRISLMFAPSATALAQLPTRDQYAALMAANGTTVKSYDWNATGNLMTVENVYTQPSVIKVASIPGVMMTNSVERLEKQSDGRMMYIQKFPTDAMTSMH